jgi:uncharacterized membrane protein YqjE
MTALPPTMKLHAEKRMPPQESNSPGPLEAIHLLRSASKALFAHFVLHGELARVEWAEEKSRLARMLVAAVFGFAALLCVMLFGGIAALALSWETAYRIPVAITLLIIYAIGTALMWRRLQTLAALGSQTFAATREELAADLALLKSKL